MWSVLRRRSLKGTHIPFPLPFSTLEVEKPKLSISQSLWQVGLGSCGGRWGGDEACAIYLQAMRYRWKSLERLSLPNKDNLPPKKALSLPLEPLHSSCPKQSSNNWKSSGYVVTMRWKVWRGNPGSSGWGKTAPSEAQSSRPPCKRWAAHLRLFSLEKQTCLFQLVLEGLLLFIVTYFPNQ